MKHTLKSMASISFFIVGWWTSFALSVDFLRAILKVLVLSYRMDVGMVEVVEKHSKQTLSKIPKICI